MKRDPELLRDILIKCEQSHDWFFYPETKTNDDNVRYAHWLLLEDSGFVVRHGKSGFRMTSVGYDYLAAVRDEGIWVITKNAVAETGGSATLEILKALATGFLRKKISQHTGIEL
ncbi:MAG: DUF2513 domain-containing protein [Pseudomonadota bacterium]